MLDRRTLLKAGLGAISGGLLPRVAFGLDSGRAPVIATAYGRVRGFESDGVRVFRGIRYGADTQPGRFMPPRSPAPWKEVADTFEYRAAAPQLNTDEKISEDCLFLNVWTPVADVGRKRPVLFYIHGGAYSHGSGSSPLYDGSRLAKQHDVVVVTANHRLNAFGYLYLQRFGDARFADSGNCGQLDLILALKWVRENIAAFGGDPDQVLAFGQSGGGAKIATMMATPAASGLFHTVATMSGQQVTASGPANATQRARAFLDRIKVKAESVDRLQKMRMDDLLLGLEASDPVLPYGSVYFGPVLDMRSLQRHPFYPDAAPQSAHIPMIIGNTHDETRAFLRGPKYDSLTWDDLPELLIPNMRVDIRPEYVVTRYREWFPEDSPSQIFYRATTAARSWRGAIIEAEERAKQRGAQTFVYQLDFPSPIRPELGAPHTFDIPLVFGNLDADGSITGVDEGAQAVSGMMRDTFVNFARTGRPESSLLPEWKPYSLSNRETMIIDRKPRMRNDPRGRERQLFATVPYVQPGS